MFRITNRMMYNNTMLNAFRNNQGMLAAQEQISSGKRINRPSDDPIGMMEVLTFRTRIGEADQYLRVMQSAESFLNTADSTLGSVHDVLKRAKELALQQASGLSSAETRLTAAQDVDNMIEQMIQFGNTNIGSRYIFSGQSSDSPAIDVNGNYQGAGKDLKAEIVNNIEIPISVRASEFLTADMNPAVSSANGGTLLASLNGGSGVPSGTFDITDRNGNTITVNTAAMTDVEDVISYINGQYTLTNTDIQASISSDGSSLVLTHDEARSTPIQAITVTSTATSQALGIDGSRSVSVYAGEDLDPDIANNTLLADLYGGTGLTLSNIALHNGSASAAVTFTGETTVGAVISTINTAGTPINVSVSINSSGRKLDVASTNPASKAYVTEVDSAIKTGELFGIGGGRNVIPVLRLLSNALKANDTSGILGAVGLLDTNMERVSSVRGLVGSRANQVLVTRDAVEQSKFDSTKLKSFIEDTDFVEAASELAMLQSAYQATLKSSAAIIQPSLLDFI